MATTASMQLCMASRLDRAGPMGKAPRDRGTGGVRALRGVDKHKPCRQVAAMDSLRAAVAGVTGQTSGLTAFPFSFEYLFYEQYKIIEQVWRRRGGSAVLVVSVIARES